MPGLGFEVAKLLLDVLQLQGKLLEEGWCLSWLVVQIGEHLFKESDFLGL